MTTFFDVETAGLSPHQHRLVTMQVRRAGISTIWRSWEMPEHLMLERCLSFFDALPRSETIVGYNILGFDLPFAAERLAANQTMNEWNYTRLYRRNWFDLYQYLGADYRSADHWLDRFGIQRTCTYTGKDMPTLYMMGDYGKIEQHALEDLVLCELLYERVRVLKVSQF